MAADAQSPLEDHLARGAALGTQADAFERRANRISLARLLLFAGAVVLGAAGVSQGSLVMLAGCGGTLLLFGLAIAVHARTIAAKDLATVRREVHQRHVARLTGTWTDLTSTGEGLLPSEHAYAHDVDLLGPGSLFQRMDVTHTVRGERCLARWLGEPAETEVVVRRQRAVAELSEAVELRQELEASAAIAAGEGKLDAEPFLAFTRRPAWLEDKGWLVLLMHVLPVAAVALFLAWQLAGLSPLAFAGALCLQFLVTLLTARPIHAAFDLIAARRGFAEAFSRMLLLVERAELESELLREIQERLKSDGVPPSSQLARLDRWAGLADFRTQGIVHIFVNPLVLWDLNVLLRLERWNRTAGKHAEKLFDALGELEALASLATLHRGDPAATFPRVEDEGAFEAEGLAHPLLPAETRVANDVSIGGAGHALIVTGSNMAGKSTLLRSVGLNVAVALAGGPVTAGRLRVPRVRLRASMRARDDLQRGASYFHAELTKLRMVVEGAEESPPVLFLLDELLRGTNAHARHIGARGVLLHLLDRDAMGMVATHDVALSDLEDEQRERVANAHFTDVVVDGEMTFDYRLRPGVVRTSNALRLLRMAGIEVPDDTAVRD